MVNLKKNILANYASQLYVTGIGILILPLYIQYMGAEAYGLVGFFTMLQAWFGLLDMGLTPTIGRETARYHGGAMSVLDYRRLFRALSVIFFSIAALGGGALWVMAGPISAKWLQATEISMSVVMLSVQIMALSVALRWLSGLYRGVITGAERIIWLSGFNIVIATLRFVAVFLTMHLYGFIPTVFFIHQFIVAVLELAGLIFMSYRLLPTTKLLGEPIGWSIQPIKPLLKFALTIAFTSSAWVLLTQSDKLILSGILSLADYGLFTLAVLVANGILIVSGPISNSIMPRMARLHSEGNNEEVIRVYRHATKLTSLIAGAITIILVFLSEPIVFAWTGDNKIAKEVAPVLQLYAIGNGCLVISAFPYYLQYAVGNLRYHLIGNLITLLMFIPAIIAAAILYGSLGAGYAWLIVNALFLLIWVAYVHRKLNKNLHTKWLLLDVIAIVLAPLLSAVMLTNTWSINVAVMSREKTLLYVIICSIAIFISSLLSYKLIIKHSNK